MHQKKGRDSSLGGYRALDLTDNKGFLCGKILADLGAEVIKIERPGGDPSRNIGPFYHDKADPEKSLNWFASNANKKGITLDIETSDGKEIFVRLVKTADLVIESFHPGFLDGLNLGYSSLSQIQSGIIMVSITGFGQEGPYRDYKTSDIVSMAIGGLAYMMGEPDRPPLRVSSPQAFLHAGAEAAVGALIALYHRELTGQGQHVDVSVQASLPVVTVNALPFWELNKSILKRAGVYRTGLSAGIRQRQLWECKDGAVIFYLLGGPTASKSNRALAKWMEEEGMASDFMKGMNWDTFDMGKAGQETQDELEKSIGAFFKTKTKNDLYEAALKYKIGLCPVSTFEELVKNPQLRDRGFWTEVEHEELSDTILYPGAFAKLSQTPMKKYQRAPLIGEHNEEIYTNELGFSRERLVMLKELKAI